MPWRREWQPTPVFWPGEAHGRRSVEGDSPWGCQESDRTEQFSTRGDTYEPHARWVRRKHQLISWRWRWAKRTSCIEPNRTDRCSVEMDKSCCSVAQLCPTLCDPHGRQPTRPPCPSPTPRARSNSCPSSRRCHPAIPSSAVPFKVGMETKLLDICPAWARRIMCVRVCGSRNQISKTKSL